MFSESLNEILKFYLNFKILNFKFGENFQISRQISPFIKNRMPDSYLFD